MEFTYKEVKRSKSFVGLQSSKIQISNDILSKTKNKKLSLCLGETSKLRSCGDITKENECEIDLKMSNDHK